jgi:hypothetical protein
MTQPSALQGFDRPSSEADEYHLWDAVADYYDREDLPYFFRTAAPQMAGRRSARAIGSGYRQRHIMLFDAHGTNPVPQSVFPYCQVNHVIHFLSQNLLILIQLLRVPTVVRRFVVQS